MTETKTANGAPYQSLADWEEKFWTARVFNSSTVLNSLLHDLKSLTAENTNPRVTPNDKVLACLRIIAILRSQSGSRGSSTTMQDVITVALRHAMYYSWSRAAKPASAPLVAESTIQNILEILAVTEFHEQELVFEPFNRTAKDFLQDVLEYYRYWGWGLPAAWNHAVANTGKLELFAGVHQPEAREMIIAILRKKLNGQRLSQALADSSERKRRMGEVLAIQLASRGDLDFV